MLTKQRSPALNLRFVVLLCITILLATRLIAELGSTNAPANPPPKPGPINQSSSPPKARVEIPATLHGTFEIIKHQWKWSKDKRCNIFDTYWGVPPGGEKYQPLILADGWMPVDFPTDTSYKTELTCEITTKGQKPIKTQPKMTFWINRNHSIRYNYHPHDHRGRTPPRQTMQWVECTLPEDQDRELLSGAEVRLTHNNGFEACASLALWPPLSMELSAPKHKITFCCAPLWGLKGTKWLSEWLAYHASIGIDHVHFYNRDLPDHVLKAIEFYAKSGFVTLHDWTRESSDGLSHSDRSYESAKYQMMADCAFRNRGVSDYIVIGDIDELLSTDTWEADKSKRAIQPLLTYLDEQVQKDPSRVVFNIKSRTILPVTDETVTEKPHLILSETYVGDKTGLPGYSEGIWHRGRQKLIIYTKPVDGRLHLPWTHAVSDDWSVSEKLTTVVPDNLGHHRHYQSHWYRSTYKIADVFKRGAVKRKLPQWLLERAYDYIHNEDRERKEIYDSSQFGYQLPWGYTTFDEFIYPGSPMKFVE